MWRQPGIPHHFQAEKVFVVPGVPADFVSFCIPKPRKSTQMVALMSDAALKGATTNSLIPVMVSWFGHVWDKWDVCSLWWE